MTEVSENPQFFPSSEDLKKSKVRIPDRRWETCEVGFSFTIPLDEYKFENLQNKAWRMGNKLGRKFQVRQHHTCYKVGRKL